MSDVAATARSVTLPGLVVASETAIVAVPVTPSLFAVIVTVPAARPVTSPLSETLATAALELDHPTARPVSGVPLASFGVAVNWMV